MPYRGFSFGARPAPRDAAAGRRPGIFHRESTRLRSNVADQVQRDLLPAGRMLSVFLILCELFAEIVVLLWSRGQSCDRPLRFWVHVLIVLQLGTVALNCLKIWQGRDTFGQHRNGLSATEIDMYTGAPSSRLHPSPSAPAQPSSSPSSPTISSAPLASSTPSRAVRTHTPSPTPPPLPPTLSSSSSSSSSSSIVHSLIATSSAITASNPNSESTSSANSQSPALTTPIVLHMDGATAAIHSMITNNDAASSQPPNSPDSNQSSFDGSDTQPLLYGQNDQVHPTENSAALTSSRNYVEHQSLSIPSPLNAPVIESTNTRPSAHVPTASASSSLSSSLGRSANHVLISFEFVDRYMRIVNAWYLVWFILGSVWVSDGGTCSVTAPHLYRLIVALTIIYYALLFLPLACFCLIVCCLPLFILVYRIMLPYAERERRRARAADPSQVQNLDSIVYSPERFAEYTGNPNPDDANCVICLCEYENDEVIRFLPCKHHFHKDCVDVWLRLDKACCLCKQDIDSRPQQQQQVTLSPASPAHLTSPSSTLTHAHRTTSTIPVDTSAPETANQVNPSANTPANRSTADTTPSSPISSTVTYSVV